MIDQLQRDYEYHVAVAEAEHARLMDTLRQRLITSLQAKKLALQRDKEKLDIADTNALLYHPNQFSINNAASPGGPQGNRKTRHTRHRLDVDEIDVVNALNGKRKRRVPADGDNVSPPHEAEHVNGNKYYENGQEDQTTTTPHYTVDKLFTDKDLITHLQTASLEVIEQMQASKRRKVRNTSAVLEYDTDSDANRSPVPNLGADGTTEERGLEAPAMERTATNQSYATRSLRTQNVINAATRDDLGELAGREKGAMLLGTHVREKKKDDDPMRAPGLTEEEIAQDIELYTRAMKAEDERRPSDASLLEEVAGGRADYVQFPKIEEAVSE